jgi:transmembrane sensor
MKSNQYRRIKALFQQYQEGTLDPKKQKAVLDWFETERETKGSDLLDDLEAAKRIYQELLSRIELEIEPQVRRIWPRRIWLSAACLTGALLVAGGVWLVTRPSTSSNQTILTYKTIRTKNREIRKIMLEDSTEIWLNAATTIRVPASRNDTARMIYLDKGEAFFKVRHNAGLPFRVISDRFVTTDIGTEFNIRAYDPAKDYHVSVTSGSVEVARTIASGKREVLRSRLSQGQTLSYDSNTNITEVLDKKADLATGWRSGGPVYLEGMTLSQIGEELGRKYDLQVSINQPELDRGRYPVQLGNQPLSHVMEELTRKTGITYSLDNKNLTINPADKR